MRLLLDTHVFLALIESGSVNLPAAMRSLIVSSDTELFVSTASLWEIAIKVRKGKLAIAVPLVELTDVCRAISASVMPIDSHHVLFELLSEPNTKDPFDRLLLAQAQSEGLVLATIDQALIDHPSAWRPPVGHL